jgi:predicted XRE-type DNA-binding protein
MARTRRKGIPVEAGSGSVFKDLGLPEPSEWTTKVSLAVEINRALESRGFNQAMAAKRLRVNQPKISALANYRLEGFSVERLMAFLTALGHDVQISIRSRRTGQTTGRVTVHPGAET